MNPLLSRRKFLSLLAAGAGISLVSTLAWPDDDDNEGYAGAASGAGIAVPAGGPAAHVVVVGGGMAGATAAKYLRLWGGTNLRVTLVEKEASYTSNIMSNLVLNGGRTLSSLDQAYASLGTKYGVVVTRAEVTAIDKAGKRVTLGNGETLAYDRLIIAPGVEFDAAYGLTQADYETKTPHAWKAGAQTGLLANQIAALGNNGVFLMTIPRAPYRCPPGPYERACLVADYLKARRSGCKVMVLDENAGIQAERENFTLAFNTLHAGVVEYYPGVSNIRINPDTRVVTFTDAGLNDRSVTAGVVNPIPPQRAAGSVGAGLLASAGLNNSVDGRWCEIDVLKYESTAAPGIHILGDAAKTTMPKAGHIANQEAKVCADAIVRLLNSQQPDPAPVTNSACYSPVTASTASWLTAVYQYDAGSSTMKLAGPGGATAAGAAIEAAAISSKNFRQMNVWFTTLMADSFA